VYRNIPEACVIRVSASDVGVSKNDIYVRAVTRKVAHSVVVTAFEYRQDYGDTCNKAECDKDGDPLHHADFAPFTLFEQTPLFLSDYTSLRLFFAKIGVNDRCRVLIQQPS
jgi:hypothetical protein